jgi:hypothetical protein
VVYQSEADALNVERNNQTIYNNRSVNYCLNERIPSQKWREGWRGKAIEVSDNSSDTAKEVGSPAI